MAKIVTMGEIMLRLSPEGNFRFVQTDKFNIIPGGGEANVAISCANYGHDSYFVSKLPKHEIGQIAVNALRRYGVNTDFVARGGDRIGLYYAETGASMRPSKVIYDRAHSAIAEAKPEDFDFDKVFEGADWFHWSGITPAISDASAECLRQACIAAKKHGVTISCDLNFRKKLWTSEKAISIMRPLMQYVDVCIGNEEDAELCLGFKPDADVEGGKTDAAGYEGIFKAMAKESRELQRHLQRMEGAHLRRKRVLPVQTLRNQPDHRPCGRRRLLLWRSYPRSAHQADPGRGARVRRGCFSTQTHHPWRLQPRQC